MTEEQKKVLDELRANDKHPGRGEIMLIESGLLKGYYSRLSRDGACEFWFPNGLLSERCNYKEGKLDGPYESYWDNGQLKQSCVYINGKVEGLEVSMYKNGSLLSHRPFKDGKLESFKGANSIKMEKGKDYLNVGIGVDN